MVKGTFTNTTGNETGMVVNGVVATVFGDTFVANHVPLTEGAGAITVTATDAAGYTASASINVTADTTGNYISLITNIESGTPVLAPTLRIDGYDDSTTPDLSYAGPGTPDWTECASYEACKVKLATEGIYYFTATGTGYDGNTYSDTIAITVLSSAEINALLQAMWAGMKTALAGGNIDGAVSYYAEAVKDNFRSNYTTLTPHLPAIVVGMGDLQLVNVTNRIAECEMESMRDGVPYSFPVLFVQPANGRWSIWSF